MPLLTLRVSPDIGILRERLQMAAASLAPALRDAISETVLEVARELEADSPIGAATLGIPTVPPGNDAPGPLISSYVPEVTTISPTAALGRVITTQPTKLHFLRYGTGIYGPIGLHIIPYPPRRALRWEDANGVHFAAAVRGIKPNDFVTPIVEAGRLAAETKVLAALAGVRDNL